MEKLSRETSSQGKHQMITGSSNCPMLRWGDWFFISLKWLVIECKILDKGAGLEQVQLSSVEDITQSGCRNEKGLLVTLSAGGEINPSLLKGDWMTHHVTFLYFYFAWWFKHPQFLNICTQWPSPISSTDLCWLISSEVPELPESWFNVFSELNYASSLKTCPSSLSCKRCWIRSCPKYLSNENTHASAKQRSSFWFCVLIPIH